jgi:transcription elongation GreA/GreB family factor
MSQLSRQEVIEALEASMDAGLRRVRGAFEELQGSLEGESKSTAGDKHETGRAMVQMEMEQAAGRLSRVEGMIRQWHALEPARGRQEVRPGAVVTTDQGGFVMGVAWGAFDVPKAEAWRAISADAPLAQAMRAASPGSTVEFRGRIWQIISVQ